MSNLVKLLDFPPLGDNRGSLVALEANKKVPFDIKRVYYMFGTKPGVMRGSHAHKTLIQLAVCVSGSCCMLLDNGQTKEEILLDSPTTGLVLENLVWHELHDCSSDCVLLVLASDYFDEGDYIRNYDDFKQCHQSILLDKPQDSLEIEL